MLTSKDVVEEIDIDKGKSKSNVLICLDAKQKWNLDFEQIRKSVIFDIEDFDTENLDIFLLAYTI